MSTAKTRKVSVAVHEALRLWADKIMQDPAIDQAWKNYLCEPEQSELLTTDHDWPLAFAVWFDKQSDKFGRDEE